MADPHPAEHAARFATWRQRVDTALEHALAAAAMPDARLPAAMRHAVLLGGKRMRPLLVYAAGDLFGTDDDRLDAPASAIELIHAYSLVHDDLPAMDDDALRRGRPTVHVAFDEATAILAGDALQTLAFQQLAEAPLPAESRIAMVQELARASGVAGMCGGQALDIDATGRGGDLPLSELQRLHALKTGALLRCAVRLGAIAGNADDDARAALDRYADALGLAFQIRDDLLDIESDSATLGKTAGKDLAQNKATFPALMGIGGSRAKLAELAGIMHAALVPFGNRAALLAGLARQVVERDH
jgi:farnesyl diphosphate synthase